MEHSNVMTYYVKKTEHPVAINALWEKELWKEIEPILLENFLKKESNHFPKTEVKMMYDNENIYVIFRVEDQYVRAVTENYGDDVWKDSAVEFFFAPGKNISKGYFNLEMNCGGTSLFHFQTIPFKDRTPIDSSDFVKIQIAHTMPKIVYPEIKEPTTWIVEYRIPFSILMNNIKNFIKPNFGVTWRANFYKIANDSSHPHWLTWTKIEQTKLGFHVPKYFGAIIFE